MSNKPRFQPEFPKQFELTSLHLKIIPIFWDIFQTIFGLLEPISSQPAHLSETWMQDINLISQGNSLHDLKRFKGSKDASWSRQNLERVTNLYSVINCLVLSGIIMVSDNSETTILCGPTKWTPVMMKIQNYSVKIQTWPSCSESLIKTFVDCSRKWH